MGIKKLIVYTLGVLLQVVSSLPAHALPQDFIVNLPQLKGPEVGGLSGTLARFNPAATQMARGNLSLPLPLAFDQSRGPLLVDFLPQYSIENGLSEWGMGWGNSLDIHRFRKVGDLDFKTDSFVSPWGELSQGDDGYWYPKGLKALVRISIEEDKAVAWTPEGLVMEFAKIVPGKASGTVYAYHLTKVSNAIGNLSLLSWKGDITRPILDEISYGGRNASNLPYTIKFLYEDVPTERRYLSLRSGQFSQISKSLSTIQFFDHHYSLLKTRWTFSFRYSQSQFSPSFYLNSVQRTMASGDQEPALKFTHEQFENLLPQLKFEESRSLETPIQALGGLGALSNEKISVYDQDLDGLIDIEFAESNKLYLQSETGFQVSNEYTPSFDSPCLTAASPHKSARQILRLAGPYSRPMVLVNVMDSSAATDLTVCELDGSIVYQETFAGIFYSDKLSSMGDINNDGQADLVRFGSDTIDVLENNSTKDSISFTPRLNLPFKMSGFPSRIAIVDVNSDGIADLFSYDSAAARVQYGMGNFQFSEAVTMNFLDSFGNGLSMSGANASFVDFNSDGLVDIILSKGSQAAILANIGKKFQQINLPISTGEANESDVIVGNIDGGGEPMLFRATGAGTVHVLKLSTPGMHLLKHYDDGKGSIVDFQYRYAAASAGSVQIHKQISAIDRQVKGKGKKHFEFSYQSPVMDSQIPSLLGYGRVDERTKLTHTALVFDNPELHPGLLRSTATQDVRSGEKGRTAIVKEEYEAYTLFGMKGYRSSSTSSTDSINDQFTPSHSSQTIWKDDGCVDRKLESSPAGLLTTEYHYARPLHLEKHIICLANFIETRGKHPNQEYDFSYKWSMEYNDFGKPTKVFQHKGEDLRLLKELSYDSEERVSQLRTLEGVEHTYSYLDDSEILEAHSTNFGVTESVAEFYPNGQIKIIAVDRGGKDKFLTKYSYDAFERLKETWNNADGSLEADAISDLSYRFASQDNLGEIAKKSLLAAGVAIRTRTLEAADGDVLTVATQLNDVEVLSGITVVDSENGKVLKGSTQLLGVNDPHANWEKLVNDENFLSKVLFDGFDQTRQSVVRHDADTLESHSFEYAATNNGLLTRDIQNGQYETGTISTVSKQVVQKIDETQEAWHYFYDVMGRLREVRLPSKSEQKTQYDEWGQIQSNERSQLGTAIYAYDPRGLLESTTYLDSNRTLDRIVKNEYDRFGRIESSLSKKADIEEITNYFYDGSSGTPEVFPGARGQLTAIKGPGYLYQIQHDLKGRVQRSKKFITDASISLDQMFQYYSNDVEKEIVSNFKMGEVSRTLTWEYQLDQNGQLENTLLNKKVVSKIARDEIGRIRTAELVGGKANLSFDYNQTSQALSGYSQTVSGQRSSYSFKRDKRGNVAYEDLHLSGQEIRRTYTYDPRSFLETSSSPDKNSSFRFDNDGFFDAELGQPAITVSKGQFGRVTKQNGWNLVYNGNGQISSASKGADRIEYLYDADQQLIAKKKNGEFVSVWLAGHLIQGSEVLSLVRVNGIISAVSKNDEIDPIFTDIRGTVLSAGPFKGLSEEFGLGSGEENPYSQLIAYAGMPYDADLQTIRMGVRNYDPQLKEFTTHDPSFFEDSSLCLDSPIECNLYSYAKNNPLTYTDPTGKKSQEQQIMSGMFFDQLKSETKGAFVAAWTTLVEIPYKIAGNLTGVFDAANMAGKDISGLASARDMLARDGMPVQSFRMQISELPDSSRTERVVSGLSLFAAPVFKFAGAATAADAKHLFYAGLIHKKAAVIFGSGSESMSKSSAWIENIFKAIDYFETSNGAIKSVQSMQMDPNVRH